jgi:hypothetical protein
LPPSGIEKLRLPLENQADSANFSPETAKSGIVSGSGKSQKVNDTQTLVAAIR